MVNYVCMYVIDKFGEFYPGAQLSSFFIYLFIYYYGQLDLNTKFLPTIHYTYILYYKTANSYELKINNVLQYIFKNLLEISSL